MMDWKQGSAVSAGDEPPPQPGLYDPTIDDPEQAVEPSFPVTVVADITIRRDFTLRSAADVQGDPTS